MPDLPGWLHRSMLRAAHPLARLWWRITRPSVRGVYMIVSRHRDTSREAWLFVRNSYKPGLTLPGGGIERHEAALDAALRETREEVGLRFDRARLVPRDDFVIDYLHRHDHVHFFEIELGDEETVQPAPDGREVIWAEFIELTTLSSEDLVAPVSHYLQRIQRSDAPGR